MHLGLSLFFLVTLLLLPIGMFIFLVELLIYKEPLEKTQTITPLSISSDKSNNNKNNNDITTILLHYNK